MIAFLMTSVMYKNNQEYKKTIYTEWYIVKSEG